MTAAVACAVAALVKSITTSDAVGQGGNDPGNMVTPAVAAPARDVPPATFGAGGLHLGQQELTHAAGDPGDAYSCCHVAPCSDSYRPKPSCRSIVSFGTLPVQPFAVP